MIALNPEILATLRHASKDEEAYKSILKTIDDLQQSQFVDYSMLFNNLPDVVFYLDLDYRIQAINNTTREQAPRVWGKVPLVGESMLDYTTPENLDLFKQHFAQTLAGETITFQRQISLLDGTSVHYAFAFYPVYEDDVAITGVYFKASDITLHVEIEHALRDSEQRNAALLEAIPDMIFMQDKDGVYLDYHAPDKESLFLQPEDFIGKNMRDVLPAALNEKIIPVIEEVLRTGTMHSVEYESINPDDPGFFEARFVTCGDNQILAIIRDITERRETESRLKESESLFRAIFEGANIGIALIDENGQIISPNASLANLTGYTIDELKQLKLYDLIHPEDRESQYELYSRILAEETPNYQIEQRGVCKEGYDLWLQVNVSPFPSDTAQGKRVIVMMEDITPRKITLNALRETEERFFKAFHANPASISISSIEDGLYLDVNDAFLTMLGYERDEVINHSSLELGIWAKRTDRQEILNRLGTETEVTLETQFYKKSGEICEVFISVETVELNQEVYILGMFLDITERKHSEAMLRESEQRLDLALNGGELAMWDWNIATDVLVVNERWAEILGYEMSEVELTNNFWLKHLHPDDIAKTANSLQEHWQGTQPYFSVEYRLHTKQGQLRWAIVRGKIVEWDADGLPLRMVGTQIDMTEQKEAQSALEESEERFRQIAENVHEVFYIHDPKALKLIYVSPAYETIWGRKTEDILLDNTDFIKAIHPDDVQRVVNALRIEMEGGPLFNDEYRIIRPDGKIRHIWARDNALWNDAGEIYRIIGIAEDITERKLAEKQMLEITLERERVRILSDFINDASHEFRTPLSIINTKLYLLGRTEDEERRAGYMQNIRDQIDDIVTLLESLVLMSKLDLSDNSLMNVQLDEVLHLLGNEMTESAAARDMTLTYELTETTPPIFGNFENIYRVFSNILENALRYTPPGGYITVRKYMEELSVVIEIEDNGQGIAADEMPQIFKSFFRGDAAHTTRGFGLGLPLAQRIIESYHGRIEVTSEVGKGSIFRVFLPALLTESDV